MKYMIASDIHGSGFYAEKLIERYKTENCDRLILLGDILYHGPRNELPKGYEPKRVAELLNGMKEEIICVRGNCDAEVDQMVLDFNIAADYALLEVEGRIVFITHGHLFNEENMPLLKKGDILLHGHTHVPVCKDIQGRTVMNPGSISLPKENSHHGYMILENGQFIWKDTDGAEKKQFEV